MQRGCVVSIASSFRIAWVEADSSFTKGPAARDSQRIGRAIQRAICSG